MKRKKLIAMVLVACSIFMSCGAVEEDTNNSSESEQDLNVADDNREAEYDENNSSSSGIHV